MPYVDYQLRFFAFASIACANLTIATANRLAIESRPAPTVPTPFLTPHIDYKTTERAVEPYQTHPIIVHATDNASIAGVSIFITAALAIESHAMATTVTPVRAPVPPDSELSTMPYVDYQLRFFAFASIVCANITIATANRLAIESRPAPTVPIPFLTPYADYKTTERAMNPYQTYPIIVHATDNASIAGVSIFFTAADAVVIESSALTRAVNLASQHAPCRSRTITTASTSPTASSAVSVASATATDSLIIASATTAASDVVASAADDITRIFSSRHSTSIAISRVLASTADADGAPGADSATAGAKHDRSSHAPDQAYHSMGVKNSPKYKKVGKINPESPAPGSRADSAAAVSAIAISKSDADSAAISEPDADAGFVTDAAVSASAADLVSAAESAISKSDAYSVAISEPDADADFVTVAAVSASAADLTSAAESAAGRGLKRTLPDITDPHAWAVPPGQTKRQRKRIHAAMNRRVRTWHVANGHPPPTADSANTVDSNATDLASAATGSAAASSVTDSGASADAAPAAHAVLDAPTAAEADANVDADVNGIASPASACDLDGAARGSALAADVDTATAASSATSSVTVTDVAIAAGAADAHGPVVASPASACDSDDVACAKAAASAAADPVDADAAATASSEADAAATADSSSLAASFDADADLDADADADADSDSNSAVAADSVADSDASADAAPAALAILDASAATKADANVDADVSAQAADVDTATAATRQHNEEMYKKVSTNSVQQSDATSR